MGLGLGAGVRGRVRVGEEAGEGVGVRVGVRVGGTGKEWGWGGGSGRGRGRGGVRKPRQITVMATKMPMPCLYLDCDSHTPLRGRLMSCQSAVTFWLGFG